MKRLLLISSHVAVLAVGFALGIYLLPILSAPPPPTEAEVAGDAGSALFTGTFRPDLEDSDFLHWGEGDVFVFADRITLRGALAPGPDYRLYLSPQWVETEEAFLGLKPSMVEAGRVTTFDNFLVPLPEDIDPGEFTTLVVWCESFSQFITAARYR